MFFIDLCKFKLNLFSAPIYIIPSIKKNKFHYLIQMKNKMNEI